MRRKAPELTMEQMYEEFYKLAKEGKVDPRDGLAVLLRHFSLIKIPWRQVAFWQCTCHSNVQKMNKRALLELRKELKGGNKKHKALSKKKVKIQ